MTIQELDSRINTLMTKEYAPLSDEIMVEKRNIQEQKELDLRALQVDLTLYRESLLNESIGLIKEPVIALPTR